VRRNACPRLTVFAGQPSEGANATTVGFAAGDSARFGESVAKVAAKRSLATLMISEDAEFAGAAAERRLALHAASGDLKPPRRRLFGL